MRVAIAAMALGVWPGLARLAEGGTIHAIVRDQKGDPVHDAVVVAVPEGATVTPQARSGRETVDQIDQEFVPHVKAVLVGSPVDFPNKDNVRHHVYSFSPAKIFELPMYVGTPAKPVVFDRPGVVAMGCNIHDWMIGYVYVAETPYFGKTGRNGRVSLNLPPGRYAVRVWHPEMEGPEAATRRPVTIEKPDPVEVTWKVTLERQLRPRRAPIPGSRGYR